MHGQLYELGLEIQSILNHLALFTLVLMPLTTVKLNQEFDLVYKVYKFQCQAAQVYIKILKLSKSARILYKL